MENRIAYLREYHGISQRCLAMWAGVSHAEMNLIEREKRTPNVYIAMRIAKALKQPIEEVFVDDGK